MPETPLVPGLQVRFITSLVGLTGLTGLAGPGMLVGRFYSYRGCQGQPASLSNRINVMPRCHCLRGVCEGLINIKTYVVIVISN